MLYSTRNPTFTGATYTDLNAVMPAKLILLFISIICAAAFFVAVFRRNLQLPAIATAGSWTATFSSAQPSER